MIARRESHNQWARQGGATKAKAGTGKQRHHWRVTRMTETDRHAPRPEKERKIEATISRLACTAHGRSPRRSDNGRKQPAGDVDGRRTFWRIKSSVSRVVGLEPQPQRSQLSIQFPYFRYHNTIQGRSPALYGCPQQKQKHIDALVNAPIVNLPHHLVIACG